MYRRLLVDQTLELEFSSNRINTDRAAAEVRDFLLLRGLRELAFEASLVCREAVNNAVLHGNASNPMLSVQLNMQLEETRLRLLVRDQGKGWDWTSHRIALPDPTSENGRGLFLIQAHSERMQFNGLGNELTAVLPLAQPGGV